jgi:FMN phosphatase YigB (HAD superfamily)
MPKHQTVLLDLDNTLISAEAMEEFPFKKKGIQEKAIQFAIHDMDGYYIVFERPHVQEFLDWLFSEYNVGVWTAASKDYALFIIEKIVLADRPERKLDFIFFSYHCDVSKKHYSTSKKLQLLFDQFKLYKPNSTIIIDDLPEVFKCQPKQAIPIYPFEILKENSENDNELIQLKEKIPLKFSELESNQ